MERRLTRELKNGAFIAVGLAIAAAGYRGYLIPNGVVAGGFTGIGQLVNRFLPVSVGTVNAALNVPMFIISMRSMGLRFGIRSLAAMLGLSLFIDWLPLPVATNDLLLASVYGGVISGVGLGLVLRGSATTGGTDMLASLIHRVLPVVKVSYAIFLVDGLVIAASAFIFEPQSAMYGLISAFICNVLVDLVLEGPNVAHAFFIISDESDRIAERIMREMDRGVTALNAMGMYRKTEKHVLLCVVNRFQTMQLRRLVFSVDPRAFVIAARAHEVLGEGFNAGGVIAKD
ncbi:MAG: YitT family protein [Clostridia bacterium]|nr:YitT family protein [Clostridia bacterium]